MEVHRRTARTRATIAAAAALLVLLAGMPLAAATSTTSTTSPLQPVAGAPPREESPFTPSDAVCQRDPDKPPPGLVASAPGVTSRAVTVVMLTPAVDPVAQDATGGAAPGDPVAEVRAFATMINKCGGIYGRKLDFKVLVQTADPAADCARATALHPFVVVAWSNFDGATCVARDHRTVMIAAGNRVPNTAFAATQGRLAVGASTEGILPARILDLVESGQLDGKKVTVIAAPGGDADAAAVRALLGAADPSRKITLVDTPAAPTPAVPLDVAADVVISTAFDPAVTGLARAGAHPVAVYSLGDATDAELDAVRVSSGDDVAKALGAAGVYGWIDPGIAQYRDGKDPTKFADMCNSAYTAAAASTTTTTTTGPGTSTTTTTTVPPALPGGPYTQVARICLTTRIVARALYNAGPNPDQRALVRALYRLPYIENAENAPKARPNQVINEPVTRGRHVVFLAKAEYPCTHPDAPKTAADARMCWVPVGSWEDGHAVDAPR